jgi:hypothetical protein
MPVNLDEKVTLHCIMQDGENFASIAGTGTLLNEDDLGFES